MPISTAKQEGHGSPSEISRSVPAPALSLHGPFLTLVYRAGPRYNLACKSFPLYFVERFCGDYASQGDGREQALVKYLSSLPSLSTQSTHGLSLYDRSQRVLDAIHEFGKGENRYLMNVGETKGREVEELVRKRKPKVSLGERGRRSFGFLWKTEAS